MLNLKVAGILLLPLFMVGTPRGVAADVGKCEARLIKASAKVGIDVTKSLAKCTALARKAIAKTGAVDAKSADGCEKNLAKVFNIGGLAGKGLINKTRATFDKLFVAGKEVCTSADLAQLGMLESGFNAPGAEPQDFAFSYLFLRQTQQSIAEVFGVAGDLQELISDMVALTDCGVARPNLCTFAAEQNPDCVTKSCVLSSTSNLTLHDNGLSATLQDKAATIQVCRAPATLGDLPIDFSSSFRAISVATSTRLGPTTLTGANATVCIDQLRAVGWCDCAGAGVPFKADSCRDHIGNDNAGVCSESADFCLVDADCPRGETCSGPGVDDCGADLSGAKIDPDCVRAGTAADDCFDAPGRCIDGATLGVCHPGTYVGAQQATWGGASGAGDCTLLQTVSIRVLPPAVCVNGGGEALGACTTICAGPGACVADPVCAGLGGAQCLSPRGADAVACTADDLVQPGAPTTIVLSTGTTTSAIKDRLLTQGTCSGGSVNAGMNCATNLDCNGGTCGGAVALPSPASHVRAGAPLSCGALDSGNLSGLSMVGGFGWLNGVGTGDQTATLTLDCD